MSNYKLRVKIVKFFKVDSLVSVRPTDETQVFLIPDSWNDWWEYKTLYSMYISHNGKLEWIGSTKIGNKELKYVDKIISVDIPEEFEDIGENYFSLGQDAEFYRKLNELGADVREKILDSLNDLAFNQELFNEVRFFHIVTKSILRSVSSTSVRGQYHRLAQGNSKLTRYNFTYKLPRPNLSETEEDFYKDAYLAVDVKPKSSPPTNLHVIIGRNGVGKTNLMKSLVTCLLNTDYGEIKYDVDTQDERLFANIITLSFSSFDNSEFNFIKDTDTKGIPYFEIGLMKVEVLEERSILIMDEPETHLHPPLIAALMRSVTELLIYRNAVGLIATHSPVIVQEVPARCVTIMNRTNKFISLTRPRLETFGENVGTLTREIFGLEVNDSGFHLRLKEAVEEFDDFNDILEYFNNQLGAEARTVIRSLLIAKEKSEHQ
ncbi:AAA family ATPase [Bacillus altitudinis]|uniref:AAA family ATPase n=1 Tax=Bacillus altitudinis TaxID=293387 RepID=UPI002DB662E5|nr:AAA family ATPase [Bacillus altitudinis]MEC3813025.1 AAA family ATPase [Bacillus altitudinis]